MVLRIHGLATSESRHGLGRTVSGSVYPKEGGSAFTDPTEGAAWIRMPTAANYPAGTDSTTSEAMVGPTYASETFANDVVYGQVGSNDGLPVTPYPFLFVGKIYDAVAADPNARIRWSATWNGDPIQIAEEGRDFLAPRPSDPGWSPEAQKLGLPLTLQPPDGPPTLGDANNSTLRRPIVAACRRYCFVYPDLPVASSKASWNETVYTGFRSDVLPLYADPEDLSIMGVLRPEYLQDTGEIGWDDKKLNPRRSVFPSDMGIRCALGTLVLTCDVYAADTEDAALLVSRTLTLHVEEHEQSTVGTRVSVVEFMLPVTADAEANPDFFLIPMLNGPAHSVTVKQYLLPPGYEYMLAKESWSGVERGWGVVLGASRQLSFEELFTEAVDPPEWPTLVFGVNSYYGGVLSFGLTVNPSDPLQWDLSTPMNINYSGDITSYPASVYLQLPNSIDAYGVAYGAAQLTVDVPGNYDGMIRTDKVIVRIIPEVS